MAFISFDYERFRVDTSASGVAPADGFEYIVVRTTGGVRVLPFMQAAEGRLAFEDLSPEISQNDILDAYILAKTSAAASYTDPISYRAQLVNSEFGLSASQADWSDLVTLAQSVPSSLLLDYIDQAPYPEQDAIGEGSLILYNGSAFAGGQLAYHLAAHSGTVPWNWASVSNIYDHQLDLGRWYVSDVILARISIGSEYLTVENSQPTGSIVLTSEHPVGDAGLVDEPFHFIPGVGFYINGHTYRATNTTFSASADVVNGVHTELGAEWNLASWAQLEADLATTGLASDFLAAISLPVETPYVIYPNLFVSYGGSEFSGGRGRYFITNFTDSSPDLVNYAAFDSIFSKLYLGSYDWSGQALAVAEGNQLLNPTEGFQLSADVDSIADPEGIDKSTISYQWLRDGVEIQGATNQTYTLTQADVGEKISFRFSYTDNYGTGESVTSDETSPVTNVNNAPLASAALTVSAAENVAAGVTLAVASATDPDVNTTLTYSISAGNSDDLFVIDNVTGAISLASGKSLDYEVQTQHALTVSVSDGLLNDMQAVTINVTNQSGDVIIGTASANTLVGTVENDDVYGSAGNDTLYGGSGNDTLDGGPDDDLLYGDSDNDRLIGGAGNDTLDGGDGDDIVSLIYPNEIDEGTGIHASLTTGTWVDVFGGVTYTDTLINIERLGGSESADFIEGDFNHNWLNGNAGDDIVIGLGGNDYIQGQEGNDILDGGTGNDTILGGDNEDLLSGGDDADSLTGGAGNDTLDGGSGNDLLSGGSGDDTYVLNDAGDVVTENADEGSDLVQSSVTYALTANVENLTLTGSAAVNGSGNALDNKITGNSASNTLDGGAGSDTMFGGASDDTYVVDHAGDIATENADEGTDGVLASVSFALGSNIEDLILTGSVAIDGTGNELDNMLVGNGAANILDGGIGADILVGGGGDDTYIVDDADDVTVEKASSGSDNVLTSVGYTLTSNVENLFLTGADAINGTGNALNNVINGNVSANTLDGRTGADTMIGGADNDTYVIDNVGDVVTENVGEGIDLVQSSATYALSSNVENLTLTGSAAINGSGNTLNNVLTGNAGDNRLVGGGGNDTLVGAAGNDTLEGAIGNDSLVGGDGMDTASYANASAAVKVSLALATAQNTGGAGTDILAGIENLVGSGFNDTLTGDANANTLEGGAGNDLLTGGAGTDTASYASATAAVTVNLTLATAQNTLGAGTDTLATIESLTGSTFNDLLTGSTAANMVDGGAGNDTITGGAGADTLLGSDGDDLFILALTSDFATGEIVTGGNGTDELRFTSTTASTLTLSANVAVERVVIGTGTAATAVLTGTKALNVNASLAANGMSLTGNAGANTLTGTAFNDSIEGGLGNDVLNGGAGADTLVGGLGNDNLTGGAGSDVFVFNFVPNATSNKDTITDFISGTDHINLAKSVMAALGTTGVALSSDAFWQGTGVVAGHDSNDRIVYNTTTGALYYDVDGNGSGAAVQLAQLGTTASHPASLAYTDFFVF